MIWNILKEKFTVNEEENKEFEEYLCNENMPEIDFQKINEINKYIY